MKQYECVNSTAVREKVYELTKVNSIKNPWICRTLEEKKRERAYWKDLCRKVKSDAENGLSDWYDIPYYPARTTDDEEIEVTVYIGYDTSTKIFLVWVEE